MAIRIDIRLRVTGKEAHGVSVDATFPRMTPEQAEETLANIRREYGVPGDKTYTRDEVMTALNQAADYVRDSQEYESEETLRQQAYGDLIVNLAAGWLDDPEATPQQIIEASYSEPAAKVLSWAGLAEYDESEDD